jgi:hypothetical protein
MKFHILVITSSDILLLYIRISFERMLRNIQKNILLKRFRFSFHRSDLESASSVACCLQQLCQSSQWQPSITFEITQSLAVLTTNSEHPKLENIFGVLVFAGFPNVGLVFTTGDCFG